jgi:hypothetical protein
VILFAATSIHAGWLIVIIDVLALAGLVAEHLRIEVLPKSGRPTIHHAHD